MNYNYYKTELEKLEKSNWAKVEENLKQAELDNDIGFEDIICLNDIADDIFYGRVNR